MSMKYSRLLNIKRRNWNKDSLINYGRNVEVFVVPSLVLGPLIKYGVSKLLTGSVPDMMLIQLFLFI